MEESIITNRYLSGKEIENYTSTIFNSLKVEDYYGKVKTGVRDFYLRRHKYLPVFKK